MGMLAAEVDRGEVNCTKGLAKDWFTPEKMFKGESEVMVKQKAARTDNGDGQKR